MQMSGSVALVTGANRGIGRAIAQALIARGASRVYAAARDPDQLASVIAAGDGRVVPVTLDITDAAQIDAAATLAHDVTALINNAGAMAVGPAVDSPEQALRRDMETNYFGTLTMIRAFAPIIERNGGGAIANVLSISGLAPMPPIPGYSASKAASYSITLAFRRELAARGIHVHAVFPGPVDTDMARGYDIPKETPENVASAVLRGIEDGVDEIFPDPVSAGSGAQWRTDPVGLQHQHWPTEE